MTVWLVGAKGKENEENQIKNLFSSKGIPINAEPQANTTLIVINLDRPRKDIDVTLADGAKSLNSSERLNLVKRCANLIAFNTPTPAELLQNVGTVWNNERAIDSETTVTMVRSVLRTIEANDGKLTTSEIMKQASSDLLDNTSRLELINRTKNALNNFAAAENLLTGKDGI